MSLSEKINKTTDRNLEHLISVTRNTIKALSFSQCSLSHLGQQPQTEWEIYIQSCKIQFGMIKTFMFISIEEAKSANPGGYTFFLDLQCLKKSLYGAENVFY